MGRVEAVCHGVARVRGYAIVFDPVLNTYVKRDEPRTRLVGLADSGHVINVLPDGVALEALDYQVNGRDRLVLCDGNGYELDINEFGPSR